MGPIEPQELIERWRAHRARMSPIPAFRPKVPWKPENLVALKKYLERKVGKRRVKRWLAGPPDTRL